MAEQLVAKLIRRHPHVFGDRAADTAADVVRNWGQIKRDDERGGEVFGEIAATLPSTLYAKKVLKRAQAAAEQPPSGSQDHGDRLLEAVRAAVEDGADPELELRRAADRYREQIERRDS